MRVIKVILVLKQTFLAITGIISITFKSRVKVKRSLLPPTQNRRHALLLILRNHRSCRRSSPSPSPSHYRIDLLQIIIIAACFLTTSIPAATTTTTRIHIEIQSRKSSQLHLPNLFAPIGVQMPHGEIFSLEQHRCPASPGGSALGRTSCEAASSPPSHRILRPSHLARCGVDGVDGRFLGPHDNPALFLLRFTIFGGSACRYGRVYHVHGTDRKRGQIVRSQAWEARTAETLARTHSSTRT
mmetsp:Transcript_12715/g.27414  ORF Transcript_12715/g.27414 Transcript_12715/m.27414 type:complete len:242 (-) Transcript_12715:1037-1762(-)